MASRARKFLCFNDAKTKKKNFLCKFYAGQAIVERFIHGLIKPLKK